MNSIVEIVGLGMFVPAAVSVSAGIACRRFLPNNVAPRYALSLAMAAGFCAGYFLLPSWAEWKPNGYWQWLPYLAIMAAIAGPIGLADGVLSWERWLIHLALATAAACLLVPHWPAIEPVRKWYVISLASYLTVFSVLFSSLGSRLPRARLMAYWSAAATIVALVIAAFISLRFGRVVGLAAASTIGCGVACFWYDEPSLVRGLGPVYSILVGGMAFVGCIEPTPPAIGILILPVAPVALWVTTFLFAKSTRSVAMVADTLAVSLILIAGVAVVWRAYALGSAAV